MKKSSIITEPNYFDKYINLVEDIELSKAFQNSLIDLNDIEIDRINEIGDLTYAIGKWTIKETIQHLVDVERILSYRAMLIARNDKTETSGFDPVFLAQNSKANSRSLKELLDEIKFVRLSTSAMFNSFDDEQLLRRGVNWKFEMPALAIGFIIAGHQIHHFNLFEQKYFNVLTHNKY